MQKHGTLIAIGLLMMLSTAMVHADEPQDGEGDLKFVMFLTRHGARSPTLDPPADSTITDEQWAIELGDLTQIGERQHYLLGLNQTRNYMQDQKILPEKFDPRAITVMSTDFNRTIMSAYSELQGYYPLGSLKDMNDKQRKKAALPFTYKGEDRAMSDLKNSPTLHGYQPIPIHVGNIDNLMRGMDKDICPYQSKLRHKYTGSNDWKKVNEKYQEVLFPEMVERFNANAKTLDFTTAYDYIDNYYSALWERFHMINDLDDAGKKQVDQILRDGLYEGFYGLDLAVRLATSRYFNFLYTTIQRKIESVSSTSENDEYYRNLKYMYLSAHDSTISAIMSGLLQKQDEQVYFASNIRTEIYQKPNTQGTSLSDFTVKTLYNGKPIHVGNNGYCASATCDFDGFKAFLQSREYDGDIDKACQTEESNGSHSSHASRDWTIVLLFTLAFIPVCIMLYFFIMKCKGGSQPEGYNAVKEPAYDIEKNFNTTGEQQHTSAATKMVIDSDSD